MAIKTKSFIAIDQQQLPDVASSSHIPVMEKFDFSQLEYSLIAFCGDIQLKVQNILPKVPVFVLQTGDETYMFRKKFEHIEPSEIEMVTPRVVIKFEDFNIQQDQNSYQYVPLLYHYKNQNWSCMGRRQEMLVGISLMFVSPNFPMAIRNHVIMSSLLSYDNTFTYEFCANTYEASYSNTGTSKEEPNMEPSSGSKNWNMPYNVDLRVPVYMPRVDTIKTFDESGIIHGLRPYFNIEIKQDGVTTDTAIIEGDEPTEDDDYTTSNDKGEPTKHKDLNSDLKIKLPIYVPVEMDQKEDELMEIPPII